LFDRRQGLENLLRGLNVSASPQWSVIERMHAARTDDLVTTLTEPFDSGELARFFPPAASLSMRITMDPRLVQQAGSWVSRRVGAWRVETLDKNDKTASLGVITPRLTRNSMFNDGLFDPGKESSAALLVRCAILGRITERHLGGAHPAAVPVDPAMAAKGSYFRSVVAKVGEKLPEASADSAVQLLEAYPQATDAWDALTRWSGEGYVLTVSRARFEDAHGLLSSELRRAGAFDQDEINNLLPLAWDTRGRVVRVTFVRRRTR
jgi:hypothetical protein